LNNLPLRLLFLLFFRHNKKPPFRAVFYKRVIVLQNVYLIEKASFLTPFSCFLFFLRVVRQSLRRAQTLSCKGFLPLIYKSALIKNILYAD